MTTNDAIITLMPLAEGIAKAACRRFNRIWDDEFLGEANLKLVHLVVNRRVTDPRHVAVSLKKHMLTVLRRSRLIRHPATKPPVTPEQFNEWPTPHPYSEVDVNDTIASISDPATRSILRLTMAGYNDTEIAAELRMSRTTIADKRMKCHDLARVE